VNRPRAVLFDWDNTLVDSWDTIHDALGFCFVAMGREPWSLAEVKARTRLSLREAFPPLFGERWEEAQQHFFARFAAIHLERIKPLPGVTAMLDGLAALGLPLGIVSNKTGPILRREAAHFDWTGRFSAIVGAGDAAADKPAAAPVRLALEGVGIEPGADIWYVGDTALDMHCAANAGCRAVLLFSDGTGDGDFDRWPPDLRFPHCEALLSQIKAL
jgi:phosphoglycolate phosphatase